MPNMVTILCISKLMPMSAFNAESYSKCRPIICQDLKKKIIIIML